MYDIYNLKLFYRFTIEDEVLNFINNKTMKNCK